MAETAMRPAPDKNAGDARLLTPYRPVGDDAGVWGTNLLG